MILADANDLLHQAPTTAELYLREAVRSIDAVFEPGYAKTHPELVEGFMDICAKDFSLAIIAKEIEDFVDKLMYLLENSYADSSDR